MAKKEKIPFSELKWYQKLRIPYKLTIRRADTYEERLAVQVSRLMVVVYIGAFAIVMVVLTSLLIAYTPLKEYIPGQTDLETRQRLYELSVKTDSLNRELEQKVAYLNNIRTILNGGEFPRGPEMEENDSADYQDIELSHSKADSLLRKEFESRAQLSYISGSQMTAYRPINIAQINFFKPISGVVSNRYDSNEGHFGVDIVADKEKTIKSVLDGTVLFAQWTLETGHVIAVLHQNNLISVYKHNAVLLKHQGDRVNSGEPIAIVGESGELSTGPHLHFELWRNGSPVNPEDYIVF
jgi:murein DD-endopeptidase MepM/ murein hydrolase activator NlpD